MGFTNKRGYGGKERLVCLLVFLFETVIIAACYFIQASSWVDTSFMSVATAMIFSGACMLAIIIASLLVCIFFRQLTVEKKILIMTGLTAVGFGILGFSPAVFDGRISLLDSVYKSFQLFVGEFGDTAFKAGSFPLLLNIARFLALFVTFGTIIVIILKQNIIRLNIRLFYRDIVVISDNAEGYAAELAYEFAASGRRTVTACTCPIEPNVRIFHGKIPRVSIDINQNPESGLRACNVKNARVIYLLCSQTSDNIRLAKIIKAIHGSCKSKTVSLKNPTKPAEYVKLSSLELINQYIDLFDNHTAEPVKPKIATTEKCAICYISYNSDEEREFYSLDDLFLERTTGFTTYFINIHGICIKQMLAENTISGTLRITNGMTSKNLIEKLEDVRLAVAGSGPVLEHVINEMARICIYNSKTPLEILRLGSQSSEETPILAGEAAAPVHISNVSGRDFELRNSKLNLLFIASCDAKEIRSILHDIYQHDVQKNTLEIMILADTGQDEFEMLERYINSISKGPDNPRVYYKRTNDLLLTIDSFYNRYGPASSDVHSAYEKAVSGNNLLDFGKLPEIYIESCLLSSIHISHINDIAGQAIRIFGREDTNRLLETLMYLASTEHIRWFNERTLSGCIYSQKQSRLHDRNPGLIPWDMLTDEQKEANARYVFNSLIILKKKETADRN